MQTSTWRAYSDDTYRDVLGITDEREIKYAEHLVHALGQIDPSLLPQTMSHPFSALIAQGRAGLDELMSVVETASVERRLEALDAIAHIFLNGGATPVLLERLKVMMRAETAPEMVACFAKCVAMGGDEDFLLEQMTRLADEDPGIVAAAARLLGYGGYAPSLPVLTSLVSPTRMVESVHVIWAIGEIGSVEGLPVLEHSLRMGFRTVECMIAIGKIGQLASIPKLTPMMHFGLPEQREAAYRALAMILHANRDTPALLGMIGEELVGMMIRQLDELGVSLGTSTRFAMLLCLARLEHKLDVARVRRYLGIEMDDLEASDMASFFIRRGGHKPVH
jgi:hypothetical protein